MPERLKEYFTGIACKTLSVVETGNSARHHQHEFNGVSSLKRILGMEKRVFETRFVFLGDEHEDIAQDSGSMTWYDARAAHPSRSEFRLYFNTDFIPEHAEPGDVMILGLRPDQTILVIVCRRTSALLQWLLQLFDIGSASDSLVLRDEDFMDERIVEPARQLLLAELGVESGAETSAAMLDRIRARFGEEFPPTRVFSAFARETMPEEVSLADPDAALVSWIAHEERLFRILEHFIVDQRLARGFVGERRVDEFIGYSLQVHNRRKARAGCALENHMEYLLGELGIACERGACTEGRSKPDFLFPNACAYRDLSFPADKLTMLGAKTTAKDRWRQILAEADRIPTKHLLTLQPGISEHQLKEMRKHHVVPVMPREIRATYGPIGSEILSVAEFVALVRERQSR